jgi:uncharacterized protein YndB with AHSA1/START domain
LSDERAKDEGAHAFTVERMLRAPSDAIYRAWTEQFDTWFAAPGSIVMRASVGEPYWFEVIHEGARHPHYGRFLTLRPGRLIEQTWVTGRNGTDGAETVVRIDLSEGDAGTRLQLTHRGFLDAGSSARAAESWPEILAHLDDVLSSTP